MYFFYCNQLKINVSVILFYNWLYLTGFHLYIIVGFDLFDPTIDTIYDVLISSSALIARNKIFTSSSAKNTKPKLDPISNWESFKRKRYTCTGLSAKRYMAVGFPRFSRVFRFYKARHMWRAGKLGFPRLQRTDK